MEITKKELNLILTEQRKEFQRHTGVLAEEFTSQVKLIAESIGGIQRQLVALREMVAKNTEDIEMMKFDVQLIKQELRQKANQDEFALLERRVALLETKTRK